MISFTRHARNRLRLWRLSEVDVVQVLRAPDRVTPSHSGRQNAWVQKEGRWFRVTYVEEDGDTVVITVTIRRRGPQEGDE